MKKLAALVLVLAACFLGYNYFFDAPPASAEGRALSELEVRFEAANQRLQQAGRSAGVAGMDTTADFEAAHAAVLRVQADLQQLKGRITDDPSRKKAAALDAKISAFLDRVGR